MPAAHVQTVTNSGSGATWSVTITVTAGNFLRVVVHTADEPFSNTTPISSSPSNTWTVDKEFERAPGNPQMLNAYAMNIAGGSTTIQGSLPGGGSDWVVKVMEFSGVALTSALDVHTDQTDATTDNVKESGATSASTQADAVAIGSFSVVTQTPNWSVGSNGYTITSGGTDLVAVEYKLLAATGPENADINFGSGNSTVDCRVAVFKAAVAAGGQPTMRRWGTIPGLFGGRSLSNRRYGVQGASLEEIEMYGRKAA